MEPMLAYLAASMYLGFWFGLNEVSPGQKDALKYVMFNVLVMPVVLIIGIVVGLTRMMRGGVLVVVQVVDRETGATTGYVIVPVLKR